MQYNNGGQLRGYCSVRNLILYGKKGTLVVGVVSVQKCLPFTQLYKVGFESQDNLLIQTNVSEFKSFTYGPQDALKNYGILVRCLLFCRFYFHSSDLFKLPVSLTEHLQKNIQKYKGLCFLQVFLNAENSDQRL